MSMNTQPGGLSRNPLHFRMQLQELADSMRTLQIESSLNTPHVGMQLQELVDSMRTLQIESSLNTPHFRMLLQELEDVVQELQILIEHRVHGADRCGHLETDDTVSGVAKKHVNHSLPKGKYREKPIQCGRSKCRPRRIIHQPR